MYAPITIPITEKTRYLGGMAALNLPSVKGTGDWHAEQVFFRQRDGRSRSFISGKGCPTDTTDLLGDFGIEDKTSEVKRLGVRYEGSRVFAANHARATADLVLSSVMRGESPDFVCLDDWMPSDEDKNEVFSLLDIATPSLNSRYREIIQAWRTKNTG